MGARLSVGSRSLTIGALALALAAGAITAEAAPRSGAPGSEAPGITAKPPARPPAPAPSPPATGPKPAAPAAQATTDNAVYAYDAAGRLVGITDPAGQTARYRYDAAGNRLGIDRYASATLSVLSVVPVRAAAGARVTLSGTGFSTTPALNKVTVGGKTATVLTATKTRLAVTVPAGAAGGKVSVQVSGATGHAAEAFAPAPAPPALTALQPDHGPPRSSLVIKGSGFAAAAGATTVRVNGLAAEVTSATATTLTVTVPPGASTGPVEVATADGSGVSRTPFRVDPQGDGPVETSVVTSYTDTAPPLVPVTTPGNLGRVQFDAAKGDDVGFGFTDSTFNTVVTIELRDPRGNRVGERGYVGEGKPHWGWKNLPAAGRYSLVLRPGTSNIGQARVTVSKPLSLPRLTTTGAPAAVAVTRPGQQAESAFTAGKGAALTLAVTDSTFTDGVRVSVLTPAGTPLVTDAPVLGAGTVALPALPETGSYAVVLDPAGRTGSLKLTLSADAVAAVTPDGPSATAAVTRPGQRIRTVFKAPAGGRLGFAVTGNALAADSAVTLFGPGDTRGTRLGTVRSGSDGVLYLRDLKPGDTYALLLTPSGAALGSATLWLSSPVPAGTLTPLTPRTGELTRPGGQLDFAVQAAAGDGASVAFSDGTLGNSRVAVRSPGAAADSGDEYIAASGDSDLRASLAAGTHHVFVRPEKPVTGRILATLVPDATGGELTPGGPRRPAEAVHAGQNARYTFAGTAGQEPVLDIGASPYYWELSVRSPDGSWLADRRSVADTATSHRLPALPATGTYTLTAAPSSLRTGTFSLGLTASAASAAAGPAGPAGAGAKVDRRAPSTAMGGPIIVKGPLPWLQGWFQDVFAWLSGDPVELSTGMLTDTRTDLAVSGPLGAAEVTRSYWQADPHPRAFGIGRDLSYNAFLHSATGNYQEVDLYLPGGAKVHYPRISPGTGGADAVFEARDTPTEFRGSMIRYRTAVHGWELTFRDGAVWVFSTRAVLTEIRDRHGNAVKLQRLEGSSGEITRIDAPGGRWIALAYDARHRVREAKDNTGRTTRYAYDSRGRLATVTDPAGKTSRYTYDGSGNRIATASDARGITYLANTYDADGRVKEQTLPEGAVFRFAYTENENGRVAAVQVTQPGGAVRRVEFDKDGYGLSDTRAHGSEFVRKTVFQRGPEHRIDAVTDPFGRRTEMTYDANGHLTSATELAGTADALPTGTTVHDGPFDQPTKVTDALGNSTVFGYDGSGNLVKTTDPAGRVSTFAHTTEGQVKTATDPAKAVTSYTYRNGDLVAVKDPEGRVTGRITDGAGRPTVLIDASGSRTTLAYDQLNQPTRTTDPLGNTLAYGYDANGNLTSLTDTRKNKTVWTYDLADRPTSATDPLGARATFSYDPAGRITKTVNRAGQVAMAAYDLLGRPTLESYGVEPSGIAQSTSRYEYGAADLLTRLTDSRSGGQGFTYDALDRIRSTTGPTGTVAYTYDKADRRTTMTAAGTTTAYGYDKSSILTSVTTGAGKAAFGLDGAGRERTAQLPGGFTRTTDLDRTGAVKAIAYAKGSLKVGNLVYARDVRGLQTGLTGTLAQVALPAAEAGSAFDAGDRLTTFGGRSLTYDKEGQLTSDGVRTYNWDARGRLTGLAKSGQKSVFGYDPLGGRSSARVGTSERRFLTDGGNPLVEQTGSGATAATVATSGLDEFLTRTASGKTQVYLTDALGTVLGLADPDGKVATRYTYDPSGKPARTGAATTNRHTFTGREDDGTGLLYYRDRYYDPETGRFVSQDPIGHAGGANLYQYALSSPTTYTDPSGNNPLLAGCVAGGLMDGFMDWGFQRLSGRKVDWGQVGSAAAMGCATGMLGAWGAGKWASRMCPARIPNSFTADTPVLMADGTRKRIADVAIGDEVLATDPRTGETGPRPVTALIRGTGDKSLVDLTITTPEGGTGTLTATSGHPFWVPAAGEWLDAGDLHPGQWLRTPAGTDVQISAVRHHTRSSTVYNLTVEGLHTYYALGGSTPVLVHNSGECLKMSSAIGGDSLLTKAARQAGKNEEAQRDLDHLFKQLSLGNMNPGRGGKALAGTDVVYARGRNGGRIFFRNVGGGVQVVGKADKGNESKVIARLKELYGN